MRTIDVALWRPCAFNDRWGCPSTGSSEDCTKVACRCENKTGIDAFKLCRPAGLFLQEFFTGFGFQCSDRPWMTSRRCSSSRVPLPAICRVARIWSGEILMAQTADDPRPGPTLPFNAEDERMVHAWQGFCRLSCAGVDHDSSGTRCTNTVRPQIACASSSFVQRGMISRLQLLQRLLIPPAVVVLLKQPLKHRPERRNLCKQRRARVQFHVIGGAEDRRR